MGIVLGIRGGRVKHRGSNPSFHQQDENPRFLSHFWFCAALCLPGFQSQLISLCEAGFCNSPGPADVVQMFQEGGKSQGQSQLGFQVPEQSQGEVFSQDQQEEV